MRKKIAISFSFIVVNLVLLISCNTTLDLDEISGVGLIKQIEEPLGPLQEHLDFEEVVKGKVWYTELKGDKKLENVFQEKLQFNTTSKIFTNENYRWKKIGRTNTYEYDGVHITKGKYFYGEKKNQFILEITEDYTIDKNSVRQNNDISEKNILIKYSVENPNVIIWDDVEYKEKNTIENL